jgi:hypothetical protein
LDFSKGKKTKKIKKKEREKGELMLQNKVSMSSNIKKIYKLYFIINNLIY